MKKKRKNKNNEVVENPAILNDSVSDEVLEENDLAEDISETEDANDTVNVAKTADEQPDESSGDEQSTEPSDPDIVISEITITEVVETPDVQATETSAPTENPVQDTVRDITPTESKRLHERFKFDWEIDEIEENLKGALDEDALDLAEPEEPEPMPIQGRSITLAQAAQTAFGLFLLIFAVIGVIATGVKIKQVVDEHKDNSAQIAYFEDFIMPLVASDSPIFEGAQSLNEDVILTAACWDIIFNPSAFYEYSGGNYSVSYLDIDRRITKLFGPGLTYSHKTVGDTELTFEYDEESGMYSIPAYPRSQPYYPEITDIAPVDGGYELTVNYRLPITNWIESVNTVEKTLVYTVVPTETDYNVVAMRIVDMAESGEAY